MYYPTESDFSDGCQFDISVALIREDQPVKRLSRNIAYITGQLAGCFTHLFPEFRGKVITRHRDGYAMSASVLNDAAIRRAANEAISCGVSFAYAEIAIGMPPDTLRLLSRWAWDEMDSLCLGKTLPPATAVTQRGRYLRLEVPPDEFGPRSVAASGLLVFDTEADAADYARYLKLRRHLPNLPDWTHRRHSLYSPDIKAILFDPDLLRGGIWIDVKSMDNLPASIRSRINVAMPNARVILESSLPGYNTIGVNYSNRKFIEIIPDAIDSLLFSDVTPEDVVDSFFIS